MLSQKECVPYRLRVHHVPLVRDTVPMQENAPHVWITLCTEFREGDQILRYAVLHKWND